MKNLDQIKERYLKESFNMRLGHLASDLVRISSFLESNINVNIIKDLLEESKFFIEWTAKDAPFQIQALLSEMQLKLALSHLHLLRHGKDFKEIESLKKTAKTWGDQLIEYSGLLAT